MFLKHPDSYIPVEDGTAGVSPIISIRGLGVSFPARAGEIRAVSDVSLDVMPGDAIGIVGESGSGKSVTWLAALGLLPRAAKVSGSVEIDGVEVLNLSDRELSFYRGGRVALISQDPTSCLNPVQTVGAQVLESLRLHRGLQGSAARAEARRLLDRARIVGAAERLSNYPHELSGGMCQRVTIAMALAGDPAALVADEPTTALDVTVQADILSLLDEIRTERSMAVVLISHDLGVIAQACDDVAVMFGGRIVEKGRFADVILDSLHPYSQELVASAEPDVSKMSTFDPLAVEYDRENSAPGGCAYVARCSRADVFCRAAIPHLADVRQSHFVACHLPGRGPEKVRSKAGLFA